MRRRSAGTGRRSSGFDGDDGLATTHPAGNLRELAWITEALQIEQDDVRSVVVGPELNQVVAGNIRLVANGGERGHSEVPPRDVLQDRQPKRTALSREGNPP